MKCQRLRSLRYACGSLVGKAKQTNKHTDKNEDRQIKRLTKKKIVLYKNMYSSTFLSDIFFVYNFTIIPKTNTKTNEGLSLAQYANSKKVTYQAISDHQWSVISYTAAVMVPQSHLRIFKCFVRGNKQNASGRIPDSTSLSVVSCFLS